MNARKPDPPTVAFDALALDALRRTSAGVPASDDAPTQLYVRARSPRVRSALQTMTVRAVAALSHAGSSSGRPRRKVAQHDPRARRRWLQALAGAVLAGCVAASLTAALFASGPARTSTLASSPSGAGPSRPAASAVAAAPITATPSPPITVQIDRTAAVPIMPTARPATPPVRATRARHQPHATTANAVAALADGDYRVALARDRELAAREPEQPVFAAIVRLLERDLARSCDSASGSTSGECGR
jgi:hypothetical protein